VFPVCGVFTSSCLVTAPNVVILSFHAPMFLSRWSAPMSRLLFIAATLGHCLTPSRVWPPLARGDCPQSHSQTQLTVSSQVKVKVTLRPTVSRQACLSVKPHLGPQDQIYVTVKAVAVLLMWGVLSDEKTGLSFVTGIAVHDICIYNFTCRHST
jgi:hypothetical protein